MRTYSSHLRQGDDPKLVEEGFSWAAFFWGFLHPAAHRAWVPAALNFAMLVGTVWLCRLAGSLAPLLGLAVLQGLFARDMIRWSLAARGFSAGPVVAAADRDTALARLVDRGAGA